MTIANGVYLWQRDGGPLPIEVMGGWVFLFGDDREQPLSKFLGGTFTRLVPVVEAPQPDWSTAPEWAMWWAASADGCLTWYAVEPRMLDAFGEWGAPLSAEVCHVGQFDIPLGVDWRLLKMQRPAVAAAKPVGGEAT